MGRLQYTNRKIGGLKLGQVVSKDLIKRIPPHAGCKAALRDPALDLDISGKDLMDEGLVEVASALKEALTYHGTQGRCTRLEELCLKDNNLGLRSLRLLTPMIRLACRDLRDLDLSYNRIHIDTKEEVASWEDFLSSVDQCCLLRRLDLSGNDLGHRAFEVLLRVYSRNAPLDIMIPSSLTQGRDSSPVSPNTEHTDLALRKLSLTSEHEGLHDISANNAILLQQKACRKDSSSLGDLDMTAREADLQSVYNTKSGLRSVPYVILCDTSMSDICALHLSYIIEDHYMPKDLLRLVPSVKAGPAAQQILTYDDSECRGIVYYANSQLSNVGLKVLELAERRRDQQHGDRSEDDLEQAMDSSVAEQPTRRCSEAGSLSGEATASRRKPSALGHGGVTAELDRVRNKIQGNILQENGPWSHDLWRAALKMVAMGRYMQPQKARSLQTPKVAATTVKPKAPMIRTLTIPSLSKPRTLKPLTPLTLEKDPNKPINPWNTSFRKKDDMIPPTPNVVPPTPLQIQAESQSSTIRMGKKVSPSTQKIYRSRLPCGFSDLTWAKILGYAVDAQGILTDEQQLSLIRYAIDRKTLVREREALGLTVATQIWRTLEATGCLTYQMNV